MSEQGISAIYLVFFDLPDNLTVVHDPSEQLCYGRRRQSHASDRRHRCQHPSTFALTRPRECQRHHEGSTPPCRRCWTCRRASAPKGPHSSRRRHVQQRSTKTHPTTPEPTHTTRRNQDRPKRTKSHRDTQPITIRRKLYND